MGLPQFEKYQPEGVALNTFGLTNSYQIDGVGLLLFGLAFPRDAIWFGCPVIDDTSWNLCQTYGATWTMGSTVTTTWTLT